MRRLTQKGGGRRLPQQNARFTSCRCGGPTGSPKRATVGVHGKVAPDEARKDAAIDRIRRGEDPFPPPPVREPTIADLAKRYMAAHVEVNCCRFSPM